MPGSALTERGFRSRYHFDWCDVLYVDVAAPAAGANKAWVVPGQYGVRVLGARATFSADGNAANRGVFLDFIDGNTVTRMRNGAGVVWTANTSSQTFIWSEQWTVSEWAANTPVWMPVTQMILDPGFQVQFTVDNKQVGDTLTALSLILETLPTGQAVVGG